MKYKKMCCLMGTHVILCKKIDAVQTESELK